MTPKELQKARKHLGLTQQELANKLGVARNTVARWEMGAWAMPTMAARLMDLVLADAAIQEITRAEAALPAT